ncbi:MAG: ethylbenzene dehydrogenase-related protein [Candidatus Eisenbacteria bacterium]|nr:ethylbenzene dehydrogenase-related protein [Candidatus Eisenbacteria bacterium]
MSRAIYVRFRLSVFFIVLIVAGLGAVGCQKTDDLLDPQGDSETVLHAVYRSNDDFRANPVVIDGQAIEKEWGGQAVPYLNVRLSSDNGVGAAGPPKYVSLKAIYTDSDVFLLVRWVDDEADELKDAMMYTGPDIPSPPGGCKPVLADERNWIRNPGGAYDEDQISIAFEADAAGGPLGPYEEQGCKVACHSAETPQFGRLGYGRLDIWQWLAARTNPVRDLYDPTDNPTTPLYGIPGYLDDLLADANAGLAADPGFPSYRANFEDGSGKPLYVYRDRSPDDPFAKPADPTHCFNRFDEKCRKNNGVSMAYIWREETSVTVAPFGECDTLNLAPLPVGNEPRPWRNGDLVSGWYLTYPEGSRADVHGKAIFDTGVWTLEIGRRLDTGDGVHDVIFDTASGKRYVFTVAVMNNSSIEHLGSEPQMLVFDPKAGR